MGDDPAAASLAPPLVSSPLSEDDHEAWGEESDKSLGEPMIP